MTTSTASISPSKQTTNVTRSHSRSPSPPPPAPPPQSTLPTPGPRATNLTAMFTEALKYTISTCSYANFAACFPTPARAAPPILASVHRQITHMIEDKSRREFDEILEERGVVGALGDLERLVAEAKVRRAKGDAGGGASTNGADNVPPHTLPPQTLYNAHLSTHLKSLEDTLRADLAATEAENEQLAASIRAQTDQVETLVGGVEALVADLAGANHALSPAEADARRWAREAGDVDVEMR